MTPFSASFARRDGRDVRSLALLPVLCAWTCLACQGPRVTHADASAGRANEQQDAVAQGPVTRTETALGSTIQMEARCAGAAPRGPIEVAVTVDDLPRHGLKPAKTNQVAIHRALVASFREHGVPQVYGFINGARAETRDERDALRLWAGAFPVANHTWSHADAATTPFEQFVAEIEQNESLLRALTPAGPGAERTWKVFRYPYLRQGADVAARQRIRDYLAARGYRVADVSIDFSDWAYTAPFARCEDAADSASIQALENSYLQQAEAALHFSEHAACALLGRPIKHILLLHAGAFTARMSERLLATYEQLGVKFVSLDVALRDAVYRDEPSPVVSVRGQLLYQISRSRKLRLAVPVLADPVLERVCAPKATARER